MIFNEEELLLILKKNLSKAPYKELEDVAKSIVNESKHWEEIEINKHLHDDEVEFLHNICKKKSQKKELGEVRLFYKKTKDNAD